eukprot:757730-Amphidinium_carterae.1
MLPHPSRVQCQNGPASVIKSSILVHTAVSSQQRRESTAKCTAANRCNRGEQGDNAPAHVIQSRKCYPATQTTLQGLATLWQD